MRRPHLLVEVRVTKTDLVLTAISATIEALILGYFARKWLRV